MKFLLGYSEEPWASGWKRYFSMVDEAKVVNKKVPFEAVDDFEASKTANELIGIARKEFADKGVIVLRTILRTG